MGIEEKLQALRNEYASELPGQISDIYGYWERVLANPADQEAKNMLLRICHNLSGTGASFGFSTLSQRTREIEHCLRPVAEINHDIDNQELTKISDLISQLETDCQQA